MVFAIAFTCGMAVLYLAALLLPAGTTWGFHFLAFLGTPYTVGFLAATGMLIYTVKSGIAVRAASGLARAGANRPLLLPAAGLCLLLAAGFLFRVRVPLLGDSWFLVQNFAGAIRGTDILLPRDEPLATYYFSIFTTLFGVRTYAGFLDAFFVGDMILGAGFVMIAWATVRAVFTGALERTASLLVLCSLPSMNLFFGYVETYSVVLFALALYALCGVLCLRRKVPFAVPALAFLLQALTHYLTVLTLPSLVFMGYRVWKRGDRAQVVAGAAAACAGALLVLTLVEFDVQNYISRVPHNHYLPLAAPESVDERVSSPYTMFSPYHLLDLANLLLLVGGAASCLICVALVSRFGRTPGPGDHGPAPPVRDAGGVKTKSRDAGIRAFFLSTCGPVILFTLVAKFDLGMARDWDVVAPYAYLLTLFALTVYFHRSPSPADHRPLLLAGGMSLFCSTLFMSVNASPSASVERFISLLDPVLNAQGGMYNGSLYLSRYYKQAGIGAERSVALWERYLDLYPGDLRAYRNVVTNMHGKPAPELIGKFDAWRRAFGANPVTVGAVTTLALELGNSALDENRLADAGLFFESAIGADSGSAAAWNNLGIVRARGGEYAGAAAMFARAVGIDSAFADAWFNLGRARTALGDDAAGRRAFARSAKLGNRAAMSLLSDSTVNRVP